jgi:hypothetical protein
MGKTRAQENRGIRQDELREQLRGKGLLQHVIKTAQDIQDLVPTVDEDNNEQVRTKITALKASAELRLRLVNKYLPDLKAMEISGGTTLKVVEIRLDGSSDAMPELDDITTNEEGDE